MYVVVICLALVLLVVMFMTDILLDPGTVATTKSYSLSRTQLALWSFLIFCSLVYVWGSKNPPDKSITLNTALILLGISSSVTVLARLIDEADIQNVVRARSAGRHQDKGRIGFFRDILSDGSGISIFRFQNVLFTMLMMIAFVSYVLQKKEMPEFGKTLLVLYGISCAGYLGAKMRENK